MTYNMQVVRWAMVVFVTVTLVYAGLQHPEFVILPPFVALLANPTIEKWQRSMGSRARAVAAMVLLIMGMFLGFLMLVFIPLGFQAVKVAENFPELVKVWLPQLQQVVNDIKTQINSYHVFEKDLDVALSSIVQVFSKTFTEGGGMLGHASQYVVAPLMLIGKALIVIVLIGFNMGYWPELSAKTMKVLRDYTPDFASLVALVAPEVQIVGRQVAFGYITVVCVLTPIFLVFFTVMTLIMAWLTGVPGVSLLNVLVISLCFGIISSIPALGAKVGLAGVVLVGMLSFGFSGWVSILMTVFGLLITTLESKFLTPKLMGKALGLNSAVILTVALVSILMGGVSGTLWTIFFALVILVAVHRVYVREVQKQKLTLGEVTNAE